MEWVQDHLWLVWLIAALVLLTVELLGLELILLMVSVGALAGMVVALVSDSVIVQVVVFALVALAMLSLVRPALLRRLHSGPDLHTGAEGMVGRIAHSAAEITATNGARLKIDGEDWLAAPEDPNTTIPADTAVRVVEIRGATAVVTPN